MITVFGHAAQRARLERELPIVTLLRGPESVGKWTLALYLTQYHRFEPADVRAYHKMDMEAAREIVAFSGRAPFGKLKCVVVNADSASAQVLTTLLKLLEEPPAVMRFILVASRSVLDTVVSRSAPVNCGLLSDAEVAQVLISRGMQADQAQVAAALARGQVAPALALTNLDDTKAQVLTALKALADKDSRLLTRLCDGQRVEDGDRLTWGPDEHRLLQVWATEAATGRWRIFSEAESFGLGRQPELPRKLLAALGNPNIADARPALVLRVALTPMVV